MPARRCLGDLELDADRELVLEDGERLRLTRLFEIGRLREHDFRGANAGGGSNVSTVGMSDGSRGALD